MSYFIVFHLKATFRIIYFVMFYSLHNFKYVVKIKNNTFGLKFYLKILTPSDYCMYAFNFLKILQYSPLTYVNIFLLVSFSLSKNMRVYMIEFKS